MYSRDPNINRSAKYIHETRSVPPQTDLRNPNFSQHSSYDPRHGGSAHDAGRHDNRGYSKNNLDQSPSSGGFQTIDNSYQRDSSHLPPQQHFNDIDYRSSTSDVRRTPQQQQMTSSSPQKQQQQQQPGNMYNRNDYHGNQLVNDNKSRDIYNIQNKNNQLETSKQSRERGAVSPRQQQGQPQQTGRYSPGQPGQPGHFYHPSDNELINGKPSKQYYDNMISQINDQIARVSEGGVATQPFNTRKQSTAAAIDDDDNEWC